MKISRSAFFLATLLLLAGSAFSQVTISRAFITQVKYNGNLGGLAGADAKCQAGATAAGWNGSWRVWLSTFSVTASQHLTHATGAYKLFDGSTIAADWTQLTSGTIAHIIDRDEFNQRLTSAEGVWTGTNANGTGTGGCLDWASSSGGLSPIIGVAFSGNTGPQWTNSSTAFCGTFFRLYCFQDPVNEFASLSGRVTTTSGRGIGLARITVTGGSLPTPREVFTGRYGYYVMNNLPTNVKYSVSVSHRRFTFGTPSRVVDVAGNVASFNFTSNQ